MIDPTSIQAVFAGLTFARETFGAALDEKTDSKTREAISEAMTKLNSAQSTIFNMQTEMFDLLSQNQGLMSEIKQVKDWQSRVDRYKLVETSGGAVVYESLDELRHYVCPRCIENKKIHILQNDKSYAGTYSCPECDVSYPVETEKPLPPIKVHSYQW